MIFAPKITRQVRLPRLKFLLLPLLLTALPGCFTDISIFTSGKTEDLCNGAIPMCRQYAGCALDENSFLVSRFPGEQRVMVSAEVANSNLVVRLLLTELVWPGTELLVFAYSPGCGDVHGEHLVDIDFFDFAGKDRILHFEIPLQSPGDHLVEIYSDMAAEYYLIAQVEGRL